MDFTSEHPVFKDVPPGSEFYFVHSYYPEPSDPECIVGRTHYGIIFSSAVARQNWWQSSSTLRKAAPRDCRSCAISVNGMGTDLENNPA